MLREQMLRCARGTRERPDSAFAYEPQGQVASFPVLLLFRPVISGKPSRPDRRRLVPPALFFSCYLQGKWPQLPSKEEMRAVRD
jgi:hypothetical protein